MQISGKFGEKNRIMVCVCWGRKFDAELLLFFFFKARNKFSKTMKIQQVHSSVFPVFENFKSPPPPQKKSPNQGRMTKSVGI